jgi:glycosyltransferase involved in cell wall biosynthesis
MGINKGADPFFSIIIPTFNRAQRVVNAVLSVLTQTFADFEVIVVDDGSTDNTRELVAQLFAKDQRVRYFLKVNEERSIARNYGVSSARGRYVNFLDSDDFLYPHHLSTGYSLLERNNFPEWSALGAEIVDDEKKRIKGPFQLDHSIPSKLIHENILHVSSLFIRREVAQEFSFIPSRAATMSEDWYFILRLAVRYPLHFDNTCTSAIVDHGERSIRRIDPDKVIASAAVVIEYLKRDNIFMKTYGKKSSYFFANQYTLVALTTALTKSRRIQTLKYLFKALAYDPSVLVRRRFLACIKHLV